MTSGGLWTFPNVSAGVENTVANGQSVTVGVGVLRWVCRRPRPSGFGVTTYSDGTRKNDTLTAPDWWSTTPPTGAAVAVNAAT